jgi:hypothetical protein
MTPPTLSVNANVRTTGIPSDRFRTLRLGPVWRIGMGMAQAVAAIVLCAVVVLVCRRFAVHVERETAISVLRGLVQMVFVGVVLAIMQHGNLLAGALILLAMTFAAAVTASRRARDIEGSLLLSFYAIAVGSGVVIAAMLASGTLTAEKSVLVPVGSDPRQCNERLRACPYPSPGWNGRGLLAMSLCSVLRNSAITLHLPRGSDPDQPTGFEDHGRSAMRRAWADVIST